MKTLGILPLICFNLLEKERSTKSYTVKAFTDHLATLHWEKIKTI